MSLGRFPENQTMTPTTVTQAVTLALVFTVAAARAASAQMFIATGHDTLRSLPGVEVTVEPPAPELERFGVTAAAIRADVDAQLRAAGIAVYRTQQENPSAAKAYLYIDVTGVPLATGGGVALSVQVQVRQTLRSLITISNIVDAMTWDARTVLVVPAAETGAIKATIREFVDQFVTDWKRVH
jgi:hypothetical protein